MDEADFARVVEQGRALQQRLSELRLVAVRGRHRRDFAPPASHRIPALPEMLRVKALLSPLGERWCLDALGRLRHSHGMKTITAQQAVQQFEEFSRLAHDGEKILVTREGRPWVVLTPPVVAAQGQSPEAPLEWPDFEAHWKLHFPEPISGPTATELLAQDRRGPLLSF